MNAEWKAIVFSLLWRLLVASVLLLLGTVILLQAGPAGALMGFGFFLAASIVLAIPFANLLSTAFDHFLWSKSFANRPEPIYGIAQSRRAKGLPEEALAEYEKILAQFPEEIRPHLDMIEIALLDLRDPARARALYLRARDHLKNTEDKATLETIYSETLTRLAPKPAHPPIPIAPAP